MKIELDIDPIDRDIYESEDFQRFIHMLNDEVMDGGRIMGEAEVLADTQQISHGLFIDNLWRLYKYDCDRGKRIKELEKGDFDVRIGSVTTVGELFSD